MIDMKNTRKMKALKIAGVAVKTVPLALTLFAVVSNISVQPTSFKDTSPWTEG
ncbi:MAG: hypothetical protein QXS45_01865 [Sulfolobales archaeon]